MNLSNAEYDIVESLLLKNILLGLSTFMAIFQIYFEYIYQRNLKNFNYFQGKKLAKCSLKNKEYLTPMLIRICFALIHPNYLCEKSLFLN